MKSFKDFLNERKMMPATKTPASDRINTNLFVKGDISKASSITFNKPDRKTFNFKGNNNSQLSFEVNSVFKSIEEMDIVDIELLNKNLVGTYEYLQLKRDGDGAFTINNPNGETLYRVKFKNMVRSY